MILWLKLKLMIKKIKIMWIKTNCIIKKKLQLNLFFKMKKYVDSSYFKLKEQNKIAVHSIDRLRIMKKIRDYELAGRFTEDVEQDPPSREIKPGEVDYLKKKVSSKEL